MVPDQLVLVAGTCCLALEFLAWAKLLWAPAVCPRGHDWRPREKKAQKSSNPKVEGAHFQCVWRPESPNKPGRPRAEHALFQKPAQCRECRTWRQWCPLALGMPTSIHPSTLVKLLFWFSQEIPIQAVSNYVQLDRHTVSTWFDHIRAWLAVWLAQSTVDLLGGEGYAVVIDECWLSRQKRSRGIKGRVTKPQKILVLGGMEINLETRRETGRCFLRIVQNRRAATIERVVRSLCRKGCEIWTDEWSGYDWLDACPDYTHYAVNHSKGEVVKTGGQGSNPCESLFSRLRRHLRQRGIRSRQKKAYGLLLSEFMWRHAVLSGRQVPSRHWQSVAFWKLLATLQEVQDKEALLERATYRDDAGYSEFSGYWCGASFQRLIPGHIAESSLVPPMPPDEVFAAKYPVVEHASITDEEMAAAREAAALIFDVTVDDPILDRGPSPQGRPGRKRKVTDAIDAPPRPGRRGRPKKRPAPAWQLVQAQASVELDTDSGDDLLPLPHPTSSQPLAVEEPADPFAIFYAPPEEDLAKEAAACEKCGEAHATERCPHFPLSREHHADASSRGAGEHMFGNQQIEKLPGKNWLLNGQAFHAGSASAAGCNCLIDTFKQLLGRSGPPNATVRNYLRQQHPTYVTASNYLEPDIVWRSLLRAFGHEPERYRIFALSDQADQHGEIFGAGQEHLHILNEGYGHWVPLWEGHARAG